MNNINKSTYSTDAAQKILLAEDSQFCLTQWLFGLHSAGMSLGGKLPSTIIAEAQGGLAVLRHGPHELHITTTAEQVDRAVRDHRYDTCFIDGTLDGGMSNLAVTHLLKNTDATVYLISNAPHAQASLLHNPAEGVDIESLRQHNRLEISTKNYRFHGEKITQMLGLATPKQGAAR